MDSFLQGVSWVIGWCRTPFAWSIPTQPKAGPVKPQEGQLAPWATPLGVPARRLYFGPASGKVDSLLLFFFGRGGAVAVRRWEYPCIRKLAQKSQNLKTMVFQAKDPFIMASLFCPEVRDRASGCAGRSPSGLERHANQTLPDWRHGATWRVMDPYIGNH